MFSDALESAGYQVVENPDKLALIMVINIKEFYFIGFQVYGFKSIIEINIYSPDKKNNYVKKK